MPPERLDDFDKTAATSPAPAAVASALGSSPCDNSAVAVEGVEGGDSAPLATLSVTAAAPEADSAVGSAECASSSDDVRVTKRAYVVAILRRFVEEWDGSDQEAAEAKIVSLLKHDGPLELGTIVSHILYKVSDATIGARILNCLGAHTFDMAPVRIVRRNVWRSAGDCNFMVGPVGVAAGRQVPTWVAKLLSHLRAGGRLGELTNEVAVAASMLSFVDGLPTSVKVERLTKILPMLLAAGCDVNAKAGGWSALDYVASTFTKEEVDDEEQARRLAPTSKMDALLAPLCVLLVEHGARFDVRGDYGGGHHYDAARKYRGWTPPAGTKSYESIMPPHRTATALEIFMARGWLRCMDAVLQTRAKSPASDGRVCEGGSQ